MQDQPGQNLGDPMLYSIYYACMAVILISFSQVYTCLLSVQIVILIIKCAGDMN